MRLALPRRICRGTSQRPYNGRSRQQPTLARASSGIQARVAHALGIFLSSRYLSLLKKTPQRTRRRQRPLGPRGYPIQRVKGPPSGAMQTASAACPRSSNFISEDSRVAGNKRPATEQPHVQGGGVDIWSQFSDYMKGSYDRNSFQPVHHPMRRHRKSTTLRGAAFSG